MNNSLSYKNYEFAWLAKSELELKMIWEGKCSLVLSLDSRGALHPGTAAQLVGVRAVTGAPGSQPLEFQSGYLPPGVCCLQILFVSTAYSTMAN